MTTVGLPMSVLSQNFVKSLKSEATETLERAELRDPLLFTTQIREKFPANFGVFFEESVGSTVRLRRQADGG